MGHTPLNTKLTFYQSSNVDVKTIKEDFIVRKREFDIIVDDLKLNLNNSSIQHYLLLGRRGSGKSTLLKRIQTETETDKVLFENYITINLAEEQANIYRLYDLLEEICQELEYRNIKLNKVERIDDGHQYSRGLFSAIHLATAASNKTILLLLDNIDRIFENLNEDASMLREYLLNFTDIKIIGGSTKMTEHFWRYNQPFYEFFRVLELKPLSSQEIRQLLLHWGKKLGLPILKEFIKTKSGQLETVRLLTDGLPRTLQFFVNILLTKTHETGYEYLKLIMDQVTPLYQERLNSLPPSQRKIILQMAFLWETTGTKEIAEASRMDNKVISAQLKQLADKGIVEKIDSGNKNHLYRLTERFFNLWLIFTQGSPREKRKAKCLTIFLENFYNAAELKKIAIQHLKSIEEKKVLSDNAALFTKALAQSKYISHSVRDELIAKTFQLDDIDDDLKKQMPLTITSIREQIFEFISSNQFRRAIDLAKNIEQEDGIREMLLAYIYDRSGDKKTAENYLIICVQKGLGVSHYLLGLLYSEQGKYELAIEYLNQAIKKGYETANIHLANAYNALNRHDLAEQNYLDAISKGDKEAITGLAIMHEEIGEIQSAETYFKQAVDLKLKNSLFHLGYFYDKHQNFDLAEKYYLLSIEEDEVDSLNNLGIIYKEQEKFDLSEKYYLRAVEKGDASAMYNLALLYEQKNEVLLAEEYYLRAIELNHTGSMNNLALIYQNRQDLDQAEKYYLRAIDLGRVDSIINLADLYESQEKLELAEKYFVSAFEQNPKANSTRLALFYYEQNMKKSEALRLIAIASELDPVNDMAITLQIVIKAWNGNLEDIGKFLGTRVKEKKHNFLGAILLHLLYHHQENIVGQLFSNEEIKQELLETHSPIYYACSILTNAEPNISLIIPPEIQETVDEILNLIKQNRLKYYGKKTYLN